MSLFDLIFGIPAKNSSSESTSLAVPEPEQTFGGVPLSELDDIICGIPRGKRVSIDQWGFLVVHYTSRSGKTRIRDQIRINEEGKLENLGGHYPGQWWSAADEFVKQANAKYTFYK